MIYQELRPLLRWRHKMLPAPVKAQALSDSLSAMQYADIPKHLGSLMTGFRRRRQDGRLAVCERFLAEGRP